MRILLLAPNAGVSLSTGGGSNFVVKQAKALANLGHEVTLAGYHALPLAELERLHGVSFEGLRDRVSVLRGPGDRAYAVRGSLPGKPSPYLALLDPRVARWIRGLGPRVRPEITWFHDDVPAAASEWYGEVRSFLYVHFPLRGRSASIVPSLKRSRGVGEAALDALLRRMAARLIVPDPSRQLEGIQANSTVTRDACRALGLSRVEVVPTYVPKAPVADAPRGTDVVSVAAFHRGKNLVPLVEAFGAADIEGSRLLLFGHRRDPGYLGELRRRAARVRGSARVEFRTDARRREIEEAWSGSRVAVSAAEFEPFGLSLLEAMSYGAHPVAWSGEGSGAWRDLLQEGKHGEGFHSVGELQEILEQTLRADGPGPDRTALDRASEFSEDRLLHSLERIIG